MTRARLRRTLRRTYVLLFLVLAISLFAKLGELDGKPLGEVLHPYCKAVYDYLKDMALVLVTVVAAYLANVFQRRQQFINALKEEWRDIISAKSALYTFTQLERPTIEQYLTAFCAVSETIDNMRTVYENVGETDDLIGLYPYAPLHDMRRALQWLEPRKRPDISAEDRRLARDAILQSFYAVREGFLVELDLEAPETPLLIYGARRLKKPGSPQEVDRQLAVQRSHQDTLMPADPRIFAFLKELYDKEQSTPKAWRHVPNGEVREPGQSGPHT
jgi:hypothetical protein